MEKIDYQKGKFYTLPILEIVEDERTAYFHVSANDRTYLIRMFEFQRTDPEVRLMKGLPCMVKDVHGDTIVFVQNFGRMFGKDYVEEQTYPFFVQNQVVTQVDGQLFYNVCDSRGMPFHIFRNPRASLQQRQFLDNQGHARCARLLGEPLAPPIAYTCPRRPVHPPVSVPIGGVRSPAGFPGVGKGELSGRRPVFICPARRTDALFVVYRDTKGQALMRLDDIFPAKSAAKTVKMTDSGEAFPDQNFREIIRCEIIPAEHHEQLRRIHNMNPASSYATNHSYGDSIRRALADIGVSLT